MYSQYKMLIKYTNCKLTLFSADEDVVWILEGVKDNKKVLIFKSTL